MENEPPVNRASNYYSGDIRGGTRSHFDPMDNDPLSV
jgi:hypothetical protein